MASLSYVGTTSWGLVADRATIQDAAWLRAALDFSHLLLGRPDTASTPWAALTESLRELTDADTVVVLPPTADAPAPVLRGFGRVMALPLVGRSENLGVIEVRRRNDQPAFSEADVTRAGRLAHEVSVALELSDARAAQHQLRLLEDRERIACDLHDQVIQRLFASGLRLQSTVSATEDQADRSRLNEVIDELDETVRQIRTTIFALNHADSADRTLRGVVIEVARGVGSAFGLRPQVCFRGAVDVLVDPGLVEDVDAVVREALTNAGKHAEANRVTIQLSATTAELRLVIEDDGVGFRGSTRDSGLANLRRRAERYGGECSTGRSPLGGVRLCWSVPLT